MSWFHDTARLVHSEDGKPLFWQGLIQDVTEAKRAEVMVEESELRHRKLVEQVPAVVFIDSHEESPVCYYVSPQSTEMLGYTPAEFQDDRTLFFRIMHPDDVERVGSAWVDAVRHRDSFFCDFRLFHRDGALVTVREAAVLIRDADGRPAYWQGLIQDLTDRKRAEDEFGRPSAGSARWSNRCRPSSTRWAPTTIGAPSTSARMLRSSSDTRAKSGSTNQTYGPNCCTPKTASTNWPPMTRRTGSGQPWSRNTD